MSKALAEYVDEYNRFPSAQSYEQALQILKPYLGKAGEEPDLWTTAYLPDYQRFDTREMRRHPLEWNRELVNVKDPNDLTSTEWVLRSRYRFPYGIVLDKGLIMRATNDAKELGY